LLAKDYDSLHPKQEVFKQQPFFEGLIEEYSVETCLDCACGIGWHLYMLAHLGIRCYGSDISNEMLSAAKDNLKGLDIPLKRQDYRTLENSWDQRFDMVICMSTSLHHMLTDDDMVKALASMHARLNERGILVISSGITDALLDERPKFIPATIMGDHAFYFFLEYPSEHKVVFNILHVKKTEESFEHAFYVMDYNAIRQEEIDRLLRETNFNTIRYFSDFDFSPYSKETSRRMVIVAQR
jgi:2-polyprenyl-3-methyl-5-hydroxy-6-metoxy-1,4-benzoquinol methylase